MSIRPNPKLPGWWIIDYRPEGRAGKREREHFRGTEAEALAYERVVRGLHVSLAKTAVNPLFKSIAEEFVLWAATNRSSNYCKNVGYALKRLLPVFGSLPPSRIVYPLIDQYKASRKDTPRACNQELEILQVIINWGAKPQRNYCQPLPFKVEKLTIFRSLPQPPDAAEFDALIEQIVQHSKQARQTPTEQVNKLAMIRIMYETGIRWIECRHLRWEDLRQSDGRLYLGRTKAGKARYTFLSPEVMEMINPFAKAEGYMFVNPKTGGIYTTIGKSLRCAAKRAGLKIKGTHTLRHALGTDAMDASGDIRSTQVALGHSDIKTTTLYTHTSTAATKALLETVRAHRREKTAVHVDKLEPEYYI